MAPTSRRAFQGVQATLAFPQVVEVVPSFVSQQGHTSRIAITAHFPHDGSTDARQ